MGLRAKRARRQAQPKVCVLVENMEYANIGQFGYEIVARFRSHDFFRDGPWICYPTPESAGAHWPASLLLEGRYSGAFVLDLPPQDATCVHTGRHWHAHSAAEELAFLTPASDMWAPAVGRRGSSACSIWRNWDTGKSPF